MDEKKNWEEMKEIWRAVWRWVKVYRQAIAYLFLIGIAVAIVVYWAMHFVAVADDWAECKMTELLCLRSRWWEIIKDISLGVIIMILGFLVLTVIFRCVARIENNSVRKMRIVFHKELEASWQGVERGLVVAFLFSVGALGLGLFILLITVIFVAGVEGWAKEVLGISGKDSRQEVIKFIGWGIAGILAFFGAVVVNRRAAAQVRNNELVERGHIQERFKAAVGHLGSADESERIASFYEFFRLGIDNEELRKNIFDILRAHLRRKTTDYEYKRKVILNERTTEEVQCLLDVLFKSEDIQEEFILRD